MLEGTADRTYFSIVANLSTRYQSVECVACSCTLVVFTQRTIYTRPGRALVLLTMILSVSILWLAS